MEQLPIQPILTAHPDLLGKTLGVWVSDFSSETTTSLCDSKTCSALAETLEETSENPRGQTDDVFCCEPWEREGVSLVCGFFIYFLIFCKCPPSGVMFNNANAVDCAGVICQEPKSTRLFLCVKTDEAGKEEGKLRHQRWHCEYLMVFMGTATDQSQKHIPGWKRVANVWLEFKQGNMLPWKYFIESAQASCRRSPRRNAGTVHSGRTTWGGDSVWQNWYAPSYLLSMTATKDAAVMWKWTQNGVHRIHNIHTCE